MIVTASPWRRQLARDANALERWVMRPRSPRREYTLENKLFSCAFAIRRLAEANKLTAKAAQGEIEGKRYPLIDEERLPDFTDWTEVSELYDLDKPEQVTLSVTDFAARILSSYFLDFIDNDDGHATGLWVGSDHHGRQGVSRFPMSTVIALFRGTSRDAKNRSPLRLTFIPTGD